MKKPLYIFLHVPKCAGSTITYHIENNSHPEECLSLPARTVDFTYFDIAKYDLDKIKKDVFRAQKINPDNIKYIYGHAVRYGIHRYFPNRTSYYVAFVREPVARTISAYNYRRARRTINGRISFETWIKKIFDNSKYDTRPTGKTMYRFLKQLGYLEEEKGKTTKEIIEKGLKKFHFIGVVENSDEDLSYLFNILGINKFYDNKNISPRFYSLQQSDVPQLMKKNKKDFIIYQYAQDHNKKFKERHPELRLASYKTRVIRRLTARPRTILNTIPTKFYQLSSKLKQKLPIYNILVVRFKQSLLYKLFTKS